jgi:hypothetical protein
LYICAQFCRRLQQNTNYKKRFKQCPDKKEHISLQKEREETNTVSENAWLVLMVEKFSLDEEQKEEKN